MDRLNHLASSTMGLPADGGVGLQTDRFSDVPGGWAVPWTRLVPLWRHAVWLVALFVVLAIAVVIRLDVQRLEMNLDRNDRAQHEASVLHQQLTLEVATRTRLQAVEGWAGQIGATADVDVVTVGGQR